MQTLKFNEINNVSGGGGASAVFGVASTWASTVGGGAVGYIVANGARGALVGGAVGFGLGALIGLGFYLATN